MQKNSIEVENENSIAINEPFMVQSPNSRHELFAQLMLDGICVKRSVQYI